MDDQATVGGSRARANQKRAYGYRPVSTILLDSKRHDEAEVIGLVNEVAQIWGRRVHGTAMKLLKITAERILLERKRNAVHQSNG